MKNLLRSATLRTLSVVCAIALVVTALPVALNLTASAEDTNSEYYYYDFATSTDYNTTSSDVYRRLDESKYASVSVSDGVLKLKNPTSNAYGLCTWVFNSKGSKATFTPGKKYTISFRWKQAVATTQQADNTCWIVVANGAKYSGDNLAGLSDSAVMPTAGDYGWAANDKTPNHRNYKVDTKYPNRHILGNGKNFNNAQNWGYKTISFIAYDVTGTTGAKNELAFTVCLSSKQEIHIDDIIVREEKASAPACTSETYDFDDAAEYNITGGLYYGKNNSLDYGTLAINAEEGALELGCVSGKDYGAATWVVNKNGVPFTMEPGKNYKIYFKYRQTVAKSANMTPWIVLTQGGVNTIVEADKWLCDAAVMGEGSYSYPSDKTNYNNYRTKQQHIASFATSETYTTFSKEFVAYDVSNVSTAAKVGEPSYGEVYRSNTLCITFCMAKNQKVLIDEITILEYEAGMDADMSFEDYPSAWTENRGNGGFFAYRADVVAAPDDADNNVVVIDNSCTVAGKDQNPRYGNDQKQFIPLYIPGTSDVYRTNNDGRAYKITFRAYVEQSGATTLKSIVSTSNSNTTLWSGQQTYYDGQANIDLAKKCQWQDVTVYFNPIEGSNVVFLGISFYDQEGQVLSRVYIDDVSVTSISSAVESTSAASLTEDAKAQNNGKQAIRFFGTYQVNDDGKVVVDGKAYTLVERGMLLRPYSGSTYEMHKETSNIVVAKTTDFSKQWKKEGNTVIFSNYLNGIGAKSYDKDVEVRSYVKLKDTNGATFTVYSESGMTSVNDLPKDQSK